MSIRGRNRKTGREVMVLRSTHFQSSLINVPVLGPVEISSMELRIVARLMARTLRIPGWMEMFFFSAGTKLASVILTE